MKYKSILLSLSFIASLILGGCDVIDENDRIFETEIKEAKKTVLLEDFTGISCNNCPRAQKFIEAAKKGLGDNLIVVSIHAGIFAGGPLVSSVGKEYQKHFYPDESTGYPAGMINRTSIPEENRLVSTNDSKWATYALNQMTKGDNEDATIKHLKANYTSDSKSFTVNYTVEAPSTSNIKLQLWLTESNIVYPQKDGDIIRNDYVHNHVLRDAVNGTWGEKIETNSNHTLEGISNSYSFSTKSWEPSNMHIVGFIYNAKTMEVLDVKEIKLINE